ncbi:MAG: hypothetical protein M3Q81_00240 [bacterium]|nr:hypothetical protein [bacterium]
MSEEEILDQYDYSTNDYLYKVEEKYSKLIGLVLIRFSELEHSLNLSIVESINDRSHDDGYVVIEELKTYSKIQLFYKLHLRKISIIGKAKEIVKLMQLKNELEEIALFRNKIVHASWHTLDKQGLVRTKVAVNRQDEYVLFRKVVILPKIIRQQIRAVERLTLSFEDFVEQVQNL